eukprot:2469325-Amphidinium_carterae.1
MAPRQSLRIHAYTTLRYREHTAMRADCHMSTRYPRWFVVDLLRSRCVFTALGPGLVAKGKSFWELRTHTLRQNRI